MGRRGSIITPTNKVTPKKKTENVKLTIKVQNPVKAASRKVTSNSDKAPPKDQLSPSVGQYPENWQVDDFYQIQRLLGEGAFGKVYQAVKHADQTLVALKVIPQFLTTNEALEREIQALRVLSSPGHDHVCYLYDQHKDEGYFYVAMEHITGGELFEHLVNKGPFSEKDAAYFLKEFAEGLAYIHSKGYVHADLKPENLMMSNEAEHPRVKIVDFGFSVPAKDTKLVFGTIAYLAPEFLVNFGRPQQPTAAADMYAVGVIMYTILTGTHPFDRTNHASDEAIRRAIVSSLSDPAYLSTHVFDDRTNGLSNSSLVLLRNLLNPNPEHRMSSSALINNPWILGQTANKHELENSDTKLKRFWQRRFRAAIMKKFQIGIISSEAKLRAIYQSMDLDGDGHVSFEELKYALKDLFGMQQMLDIFNSVDINNDGSFEYDEFASIMKTQFETNGVTGNAAAASPTSSQETNGAVRSCILKRFHRRASQDVSRLEMKQIFDAIDLNRDGSVEISEIIQALDETHCVDAGTITVWADTADRDLNGKIDFEEFCIAMAGR